MQVVRYPEKEAWKELLKRPVADSRDLEALVGSVFEEVGTKGDEALRRYTEKFDKVPLGDIRVPAEEIDSAAGEVPQALKEAIELAYENIYAFHAAQRTATVEVATQEGVACWQEKYPIQRV